MEHSFRTPLPDDHHEAVVVNTTVSQVRNFLYELAGGTSNYRSLHSLTAQVEHQYHGRFLVELIQNAHDALAEIPDANAIQHIGERRVGRCIKILLAPDEEPFGTLYIANDGNPFSCSNFHHLSQLGQSDKDPQKSIGNKGIGFRSVLEITDCPEIYSRNSSSSLVFDGFCFGFSQSVIQQLSQPILALLRGDDDVVLPFVEERLVDWDAQLIEKFRTTVSPKGEGWLLEQLHYLSPYLLPFPIKAANAPVNVKHFESARFATVVRLPLKSAQAKSVVLKSITDLAPATVLFLEKAGSIVLDNGAASRDIMRDALPMRESKYGGREIIIHEQKCPVRKFWLWSRIIDVAEATEFKSALSVLPGKWPELTEIVVSVSVELSDKVTPGTFSIFLPTLLETGCGAFINAPFFGDMSRTSIDFTLLYNQLVQEQAADLIINVVKTDLAGQGADHARAIIDLIGPHSSDEKLAHRWLELIQGAAQKSSTNVAQEPWYLSDRGWVSLTSICLLPEQKEALVITREALRTHARFPALISDLDTRLEIVRKLLRSNRLSGDPTQTELAESVEALAQSLWTQTSPDWNAFWSDAQMLFKGDSTSLMGKRLLLGNDQKLHSSGGESTVFFVPRQGGGDDEEVGDGSSVVNIPQTLRRYVAFLDNKIRLYDEKNARLQTPVRKFLEVKLVNRFRVEDIFASVLVPRTPRLPIGLTHHDSVLCQEIMHWGLQLMSDLIERDRGEKSIRLLKDIPVPCRGGWHKLADALFSPGWEGQLGSDTLTYLNVIDPATRWDFEAKLLLPPTHQLWHGSGEVYGDLLARAGVTNGLPLIPVSPSSWPSSFSARKGDFRLPAVGPSGIADQFWKEYVAYAQAKASPSYQGFFQYEVGDVKLLPGMGSYEQLGAEPRIAFMNIILGGMALWPRDWRTLSITKASGNPDSFRLESPLHYWLRTHRWLGTRSRQEDRYEWSRPRDRWHIPASVLAWGGARRFSHLKPWPLDLAQRFDVESLAITLQDLGMPHLDFEKPSDSTRLLDDLAAAARDADIADWNVFLGQVRDAWRGFYPSLTSPFPKLLLVSERRGRLATVEPTPAVKIFLPDASPSLMSELERFDLRVLAIAPSDAKRLAQAFQRAYGAEVQLASQLKVIPLHDGGVWNGDSQSKLADSEVDTLITLVLTVLAFGGDQPRGAGTRRFHAQLKDIRDAYVAWVTNLEVGLLENDREIIRIPVNSVWHNESKTLVLAERCREAPVLLAESMAHMIAREDLVVSIKFLFSQFSNLQPDRDEVGRALAQLNLSERQYFDVREQWRGDLGHVISMILPLVAILCPGVGVHALMEAATDEAVIAFVDTLGEPRLDPRTLLAMARRSEDKFDFGWRLYRRFADDALQLANWNAALAAIHEQKLVNQEAERQFLLHANSSKQPLKCAAAALIRRGSATQTYRKLSDAIDSIKCPADYADRFWEVTFQCVMELYATLFLGWGASQAEAYAIERSSSSDDLIARLGSVGFDVSVDPNETYRRNQERTTAALARLQEIGLAWALNHHANPEDWEDRGATYLNALANEFESEAYISQWSEDDVFKLLKKLPPDPGSDQFWHRLVEVTNFDSLIEGLGLSPKDLRNASTKLRSAKEDTQRRNRLVWVCGKPFDNSEENLKNLWCHITIGIPDGELDRLGRINVGKFERLQVMQKRSNVRTVSALRQERRPPPPPRTSKSMEELIGLSGEIHAFRMLQHTYGTPVLSASAWVSGNSRYVFPNNEYNDGLGYDFTFSVDRRTYFVEVKSTNGEDVTFTLGSSEIQRAKEQARGGRRRRREVFVILRVTKATSTEPCFQILPNPYDPRYEQLFMVDQADARVTYRRETSGENFVGHPM